LGLALKPRGLDVEILENGTAPGRKYRPSR
jgi:hypothetical protein